MTSSVTVLLPISHWSRERSFSFTQCCRRRQLHSQWGHQWWRANALAGVAWTIGSPWPVYPPVALVGTSVFCHFQQLLGARPPRGVLPQETVGVLECAKNRHHSAADHKRFPASPLSRCANFF